jgi:Bacterial TniB protein/Mu DNA binding, I gamma subdomain
MSSGLVDPNDPPLPEVERRAAVLRDLLRQSGWKVTAEVADAALAQLGIPRSTLFRAVARFRRTRRASSLLPLKRGTRDGSLLLDPRIERIIEEQIERFWLKKEKPRFSALVERVHDACHVEGLRAPHRKTIKRRVVDLNPLAAARRRGQGALAAASTPSPGQFVADRPNAIWQIDHDEVHNLLAGSPREQRVILQLFRHLSNELKASLVCLGVADARDAIAGDVQLARRLDQLVLPRWKGDEEFQEMVTAILRSLPLKRPSVLSAQGLRHLVRIADGITARVFGVLNELAIDAVETGAECISDTVIETWKPAIEKEAAFA